MQGLKKSAMKSECMLVGVCSYNPPTLKLIVLQQSNSLMTTSNVEGRASISDWVDGGTDDPQY